jgi:fructokinase
MWRRNNPMTVVGLGEVLFDVFEDGTATLGGAPLNVAVHVHQLASALKVGEGVIVSRVGNDLQGEDIARSLAARHISTEYLQLDRERATGRVSVFMKNGEPGYQIEPDAAWDFLCMTESLEKLAARCDGVCFGSLAQRSARSREAIQEFLRAAGMAIRLYDINLRRNTLTKEAGYSTAVIRESCELATMVKMNSAELPEICHLFGVCIADVHDTDQMHNAAVRLLEIFPLEAAIITDGAQGTKLFTKRDAFTGRVLPKSLEDVYPVGAGDACSAGILFGTVLGWPPDDAVDLANQMGTWVASQLSATPPLPDSILRFAMERMEAQALK